MENEKPRYKKKGPIRFEAIVPFAIVLALIVAYFVLFFDRHLRQGIEWAATAANGAEANIGSLHTSFVGATFKLADLELTDPKQPDKNRLQIGEIKLGLLWDALLRAKFVVNQASVTGILANSPRKRPGRVLPPEEKQEGQTIRDRVMEKVREAYGKSALADAAALLEGFDPTRALAGLGDQLKSVARAKELQTELTKKQKQWQSTLENMPGEKDIAALQKKISEIPADGNVRPDEIPGKIQLVNSLLKEGDAKVAAVRSTADSLTKDITGFSATIGQLDDLAKQDRLDLEKKIKLPSLDAKDLAGQLFGNQLLDKVDEAQRYAVIVRQYMPAKGAGSKKEPAAEPKRPRGAGKNYEFGRPNSYPKVWIRKMEVASQAGAAPYGGDLSGEITDITSSPPSIGKPTVAKIRGSFPAQRITGVELELSLDHTQETPVERLQAKVDSYPIGNRMISQSEGFAFGFNQATGASKLHATLEGGKITLASQNEFKQLDYKIESKSKILASTLRGIVSAIPVVTVSAQAAGSLDGGLDLALSSNLASELERGFAKQLQAQLAEARKRLDTLIESKLAGLRTQVLSKYSDTKGGLFSKIEEKRKKVDELKAMAESRIAALQNRLKSGAQNKALDAVKKKLPFGR